MRTSFLPLVLLVTAGCGSDEAAQSPGVGGAGGNAGAASGGAATAGGSSGSSSSGGSVGGTGGAASTGGAAGSAGEGGGSSQLCLDACEVFTTCDAALNVTACAEQCDLELAGEGYLSVELAERFFTDMVAIGTDTSCFLTRTNRWWVDLMQTSGWRDTLKERQTFDACRTATLCERTEPVVSENCLLYHYRYNNGIREQAWNCLGLCSQEEPQECFSKAVPEGQPWIAGLSPL